MCTYIILYICMCVCVIHFGEMMVTIPYMEHLGKVCKLDCPFIPFWDSEF